jgi:hypothetical protein
LGLFDQTNPEREHPEEQVARGFDLPDCRI